MRDLLLGRTPKDWDFAFSGGESAFVQSFPRARKVGKTVDVWLLNRQEFRPLQGSTLEEDLLARDLTVNALAVDEQGRLHAHPRALADLHAGVLRPASAGAFRRDPVRVFRVARMAAQWPDFQVDEEVYRQMRELEKSQAFVALPPERVCREVMAALQAASPRRFLEVLNLGGALSPWLNELAHAATIPAGPLPWHDNSVLDHTGDVMDKVAGNDVAVWMALCHDMGKVLTESSLWPHHYKHEARGEALARSMADRLGMPRLFRRAGVLAARLHGKGGLYATLRPGRRRDLLCELHAAHLACPFWAMVSADSGLSQQVLEQQANEDWTKICAVHLPSAWRNRGEESGQRLRDLQCMALPSRPAPESHDMGVFAV